jgi:hypothetical protein
MKSFQQNWRFWLLRNSILKNIANILNSFIIAHDY